MTTKKIQKVKKKKTKQTTKKQVKGKNPKTQLMLAIEGDVYIEERDLKGKLLSRENLDKGVILNIVLDVLEQAIKKELP